MIKLLLVFLDVLIIASFICPQSAYGQQQPLTSDALFSKTNNDKSFPASAGEKYLVLNKASRVGKFRRYRFIVGQQVNFKVKNNKRRYKTKILSISDSSFTVANETTGGIEHKQVLINDIRLFKVSKRIPFVSEAAYYFPIGGLLYIGADFVNKGIDDKRFTTGASAFIVGGALIAAGFVCHKLSSCTIKINNRNKLKVLTSY